MPIHGFTKEVKKFFFFFAAMLFFAGFGLVMAQLGNGISFYLFIWQHIHVAWSFVWIPIAKGN